MTRMTNSIYILLLVIIFITSLSLRLYKLGKVPNGLSTDEADMGYNAYALIRTGEDVYGRKFPLFFQSLDDYKPGIPIYSLIPAVKYLGLSEYSIRLVPALIASFTPLLMFFLLKLLYPKDAKIAPIAATLMVFAPWNIAISRATLQYIEMFFSYQVFFVAFLLAVKKNQKFLPVSFLVLGLTLYVYYAAVIYLPFICLILFYLYRHELLKNLRLFIISVLILMLVSAPAIAHYKTLQSKSRFNVVSVFNPEVVLPLSIAEIQQDKQGKIPFSSIIHNRRLIYTNTAIANYFDYFNFNYLFTNSRTIRYFAINGVGLFYLLEVPFFLYGLYLIVTRKSREDQLILSLLLVGPVPAMITLGTPFPHRALLFLMSVQVISAIGATSVYKYLHRFSYLIVGLYIVSIYFFLHQYYIHSPKEFTTETDNRAWFSTVKEAIPKVNQLKTNYDKVVFTWSVQRLVPPIYFLFYNKIDPRIVQNKAIKWTNEAPSYKQIYNQVENIEFKPINWKLDKDLRNTLFVGYPEEFDEKANISDKTYLLNGDEHFVFVETQ